MLRSYITIAIRNLFRNKTYSFINVFGLSVGLTCTILILLFAKDDLTFDRFHHKVGSVYRIVTKADDGKQSSTWGEGSLLLGPRFKDRIPEIDSYVRIRERYYALKSQDNVQSQKVLVADTNFFTFFDFPLLYGNPATALTMKNSVVIDEAMAIRLFGRTDVLGETLNVIIEEELAPHEITGVAKMCPENSSIQFEAVLPLIVPSRVMDDKFSWVDGVANTFVRLDKRGQLKETVEKMQKEYDVASREVMEEVAKQGYRVRFYLNLQPMTDIHLADDYRATGSGVQRAGSSELTWILVLIAFMILTIASINFINLTVAWSAARAKEIGVRKVVGSSRKQLIFQYFGESFIMCGISFILALSLAWMILPVFNELVGKNLSISYLLDFSLICVYLGLFIVTAVLSGAYPALVMSSFKPVSILYHKFRLVGNDYFQKSLVMLQFGLATILTIAAFAVYAQYDLLITMDTGIDRNDVFVVEKSPLFVSEVDLFRELALKNPSVATVAPLGGDEMDAKVNGETMIHFKSDLSDSKFIPLFGIRLVLGRNFVEGSTVDSTESVIVNETFVKVAGWQDPVGQQLHFFPYDGIKRTVIGVVKDWHHNLLMPVTPHAIIPKPNPAYSREYSGFVIKIVPGTEHVALPHIERTFKSVFPMIPYYATSMVENEKSRYGQQEQWRKVIGIAAFIVLIISCTGLFGLSLLTAERRMKEMSIRKVLGATIGNITVLLSRSILLPVLIAMTTTIPVALYVIQQWLEEFPNRIEPGPGLIVVPALFILAVALLTIIGQALRAGFVSPASALKGE